MKLIKYFLQRRSVTILLLVLVLAGGLFAYLKMGKLEDAPFTIKQALVLTPYPGASSSEVQSQVTDVLEEAIQSVSELYYLKTENRAGLSKITVFVKKETRADGMQQLWDKLRRKVGDVQGKLPAGAGPSVVNDDFGDVLGVFYGLTGEGRSYRELEEQAKLIKNELLKVKDVARIEIYGTQTPTIDVVVSPSVMSRSGITTADIAHAFNAQNKVVDAGGITAGTGRIRMELTGTPSAAHHRVTYRRTLPAGRHCQYQRGLSDTRQQPDADRRTACGRHCHLHRTHRKRRGHGESHRKAHGRAEGGHAGRLRPLHHLRPGT